MSTPNRMIWQNAWTDTRHYFRIGFLVLTAMVGAMYMSYPGEPGKEFPHGALAVGVEQVRTLAQDARSYIWLHWFANTLVIWLPLLALALASPGIVPVSGTSSAGMLYSLSMPVSRRRLAGVRIATGWLELLVAAIVPSILVCAVAPLRGAHYSLIESLIHALVATAGATALYGLFVFLSAMVGETGKAVLGISTLFLYAMFTFLVGGVRQYSILRVMTGDTYFLRGEVPWLGGAACVAAGLALMYAGLRVAERRDC
jgi:hypothetical protein